MKKKTAETVGPKEKPFELKNVDFSSFRIRRKKVSINGKELPIAIGDRMVLSVGGPVKTVMGIMIQEDGRVTYILEWHDTQSGGFTSEQLTLSELKLLDLSGQEPEDQQEEKIGFGQDKED